MHVWEAQLRPKDNDLERTFEWWKGLLTLKGGENFENGVALNRMDGENSVLIIRHRFSDLAEEQRVFEAWHGSECQKRAAEEWSDYVDGPGTRHRYNVLRSY